MIALKLYDPLLRGGAFRVNVTQNLISSWRRSIRRAGGYWYGEARYDGPDWEKLELFNDGLGRHLVESAGGLSTWEGFIAEMVLTYRGQTYSRSIIGPEFANAVMIGYQRVGDNLLTNGSGESGAWAAYNGPSNVTVTQDATWLTHGAQSIKIVVADTAIRGAVVQSTIAVTAGVAYQARLTVRVDAGSWRMSCNRADTDESLCFWSARGKTGVFDIDMTIPDTNTYTGNIDFRITSEANTGTLYADGAIFREAPREARTAWSVSTASAGTYGRVEAFERREEMTDAEAAGLAARLLEERSIPRLQVPSELQTTSGGGRADAELQIIALGYVHTLRRVPLAAGTGNASAQVTALLAGNEFLTTAEVATNTLQFQITDDRLPQIDWLARAVAAGDSSGNRWQGRVTRGRRFTYGPADTAVAYVFRNGQFHDLAGAVIDPWWAQPGMVRIDDLPKMPTAPNDERLFYADEVEAGPQGVKMRRLPDG